MFKSSQRGVAIFLALIVMIPLLAVAMGVSIILLSQLRMLKEQGYSVIAFYAADTGIERAVYEDRVVCRQTGCPGYCVTGCLGLPVGYTYSSVPGETLAGATFKFQIFSTYTQSAGIFREVRRAIEITR